MLHPVTYVNKVLLYGPNMLQLVNPIANKTLYSFPRFARWLADS